MKLRDYQLDLISKARNSMKKGHRRIILQLGTGGGKTVCFTYMVKQASEKGLKCMILTDRTALLNQAGGTFDTFGVDNYSGITRNTKTIPNKLITLAMAETIKRRCSRKLDYQILLSSIDILIIDEAHKATFNKIFQYLKPKCYVYGFTATPISANKKDPLSNYYTDIVQGKSIEWMIENGFLAKPWYGRKKLADLSNVKKKGRDFDEEALEKAYTEVKVFEGLKEAKEKEWGDRKTIIFCPNVTVSKQVAEQLRCLHVDGYMDEINRMRVMSEFENNPKGIISNVDILTTGYDHPPICNIVLYRDTLSLPLYLQMDGRGGRVTDTKKHFFIYDFGKNIERHGHWHIEREWTLEAPKVKKKDKQEMYPVKDCPSCGALITASAKKCEYCGYTYPIKESEKVRIEFEMMSYEDVKNKVKNAKNVNEIEEIRIAKDYKMQWALRQFKSLEQFQDYAKLKNYKSGWVKRMSEYYL